MIKNSLLQPEREKEKRKSIGKAAIGGAWELKTTTGDVKKSSDFFDKWVVIYFGFTHCPDVCPDELEKMAGVVDDLGEFFFVHHGYIKKPFFSKPFFCILIEKRGVKIQPLFITVDPERDTPEALDKYIKEFSSKLIGLTGTKEQINSVCKKFRVYYSAGPRDADNDYIVSSYRSFQTQRLY